jgi:hypothetical protein
MFFKNKSTEQIMSWERAKERKIVESYYLKEIQKLRSMYGEDLHDREVVLKKEYNKSLEAKNQHILELEQQIKENRRAWKIIKDFVPKAVRLANFLKAESKIRLEQSAIEYSKYSTIDFDIEYLSMDIDKATDKIERLMKYEVN